MTLTRQVADLKAADRLAVAAQEVLLEVVRTNGDPGQISDLWRALRHYQRRRYRSRSLAIWNGGQK